jgi:hypothetical protein
VSNCIEPYNNVLYVFTQENQQENKIERMETEHEKADRNLFNDLMDYVGTEGKFQFRFNYLYNMALMVLVALPALNIVLALSSPDHWCHVPGRSETNLTSLEWKELTVPRYKAFFSTKRECICDIALHVAFLD